MYVYFGSYGLICYNHEGVEKWSKKMPTPKSLYGMSTSPLVHKDNVILVLDNDNNIEKSLLSKSKIIALNRFNGKIIWTAERPHHRSGWSTPIIWENDKGTELIVLGNEKVRSYNPQTGSEIGTQEDSPEKLSPSLLLEIITFTFHPPSWVAFLTIKLIPPLFGMP